MSSEEIKNLKRHIEDESEFNSLIDALPPHPKKNNNRFCKEFNVELEDIIIE